MSELHKKSTTKGTKKPLQLTEERVREIAREEIRKHTQGQVEIILPPSTLGELTKLGRIKGISRKTIIR